MDSESLKHLEEAKKGKLRRFVIILKGVKILSMVIFKRGSVSKYKKEAKKEAKGQFFHGIISGKGKKSYSNSAPKTATRDFPEEILKNKNFLNALAVEPALIQTLIQKAPSAKQTDIIAKVYEDLQSPVAVKWLKEKLVG